MPSLVDNATWSSGHPVISRIAGVTLAHEQSCILNRESDQPHECDCCLSQIRLIKTPAGNFLPTTEPDLSADVRFWRGEARRLRRCLVAVFGIAAVSSLLNILYGLTVL